MKKFILSTIFTTVAFFGMNAQTYKWWAGGHTTLWAGNPKSAIIIAPEVGYHLSPKFTVAASVGIHTEWYSTPSKSVTGLVLNPYMRYTAFKQGMVLGFVDGGLDLSLGDFNGYQLGFKPGIAVLLTERFTAATQFGFLGYSDGKGLRYREKGFGFDFSGYCSTIAFFYSF